MSKISHTMKIALYEARLMLFSSRFFVLSLFSFIFIDMVMRPIRQFAMDYHLDIVPAVFPFYCADITHANVALLLLVLLYSDIPLKGSSQQFLLIRAKSLTGCALGHVISLLLTGIVYVLEMLLFSVITAMPSVAFDGWGKVWGSIASGKAGSLGYLFYVGASDKLIRNYTPIQAICLSASLFLLTGFIYGLIEYLLNGLSRGRLGTVVLSLWSVAWIFLSCVRSSSVRRLLDYSPQTWNNLSRVKMSALPGRFGILAAIIVALSLVVIILVRHRKIELVK